jgi:DNA-binding transcriptional MocR family regulator
MLGAQGRNRTVDRRIFSPLLYRLSYLGPLRISWTNSGVTRSNVQQRRALMKIRNFLDARPKQSLMSVKKMPLEAIRVFNRPDRARNRPTYYTLPLQNFYPTSNYCHLKPSATHNRIVRCRSGMAIGEHLLPTPMCSTELCVVYRTLLATKFNFIGLEAQLSLY